MQTGIGSTRASHDSAAKAVSGVRSGDTVFVATAASCPTPIVEALYRRAGELSGVTLMHFITDGLLPAEPLDFTSPFVHRSFFIGHEMRQLMDRGSAVEYIPLSIAQVPMLVRSGRLHVDVALVQTTLPDPSGRVRLGLGVDIAECMIDRARLVVAELNARMPRAQGDTLVPIERLHAKFETDREIAQYAHPHADAVSRQVARYIGSLIEDGSTLQVGVGQIPNEALRFLTDRQHLGIHSDLITDSLIDLIDSGVADGSAKSTHRGVALASYCFGTRRLYDRIDGSSEFFFQAIDRVCDPQAILAQHRMVSISQVFSIDLTGQACADQFGGRLYGGPSAQAEFLRATAQAPDGRPIICLASTTPDMHYSRIRPMLPQGEGVMIARSDVHHVVTEYGIANLFGKSLRERALALIELAHPKFREWLLEEAKQLGYLPGQQTMASQVAYPVDEERRFTARSGEVLHIRPARASDGDAIRALFYGLSEDDIYTRFFSRLTRLSFGDEQRLCNVNYDTEVAFMVEVGERGARRLVGTASYHVNPADRSAEVAFMVLPEWQGQGLGKALQGVLIDYGTRHGIKRFVAEVLRANARMVKLARSSCAQVEVAAHDDALVIVMTP